MFGTVVVVVVVEMVLLMVPPLALDVTLSDCAADVGEDDSLEEGNVKEEDEAEEELKSSTERAIFERRGGPGVCGNGKLVSSFKKYYH